MYIGNENVTDGVLYKEGQYRNEGNMKCIHCGAEIPEDVKFCEVCGKPVTGSSSDMGSSDAGAAQSFAGESQGLKGTGTPEKKSRVPLFAGIAVLVIAIVSIVAFAVPKLRKASMSPAEYMQYAEGKERDEAKKAVTDYLELYKDALDFSDSSRKGTVKMEISDSIKTLISSYTALMGMDGQFDLSKLNDIELETTIGKKDTAVQENVLVKANGETLLTVNLYMDLAKKKMYYQIPELSEAYLDASSSFEDLDDAEGNPLELANAYLSGNLIPTAEDAEKIYDRYSDLLIQSLKKVEKKEEQKCEAEGVSQEADLYTAEYEGEEIVKLVKDFAEALKSDEQILFYLEKAGVEKSKYTEEIDEFIEELNDIENHSQYATIADYIADDTIIGRQFNIYKDKDAGEALFTFQMYEPKDGDKFGSLIYAEYQSEEVFKLYGKGTLKNNVADGEFSVEIPELKKEAEFSSDEIVKIKLSDYDLEKAKKGEGAGKMEFSMPGLAQLATAKLVVESSGTLDKADSKIDVSMGEQQLVTLAIESSKESAIDVREPGSGDKIYEIGKDEDMQAYMLEMDTETVLNHVKEVTGIDLSALLGAAASSALQGLSADTSDNGVYTEDLIGGSDGPTSIFLAKPNIYAAQAGR